VEARYDRLKSSTSGWGAVLSALAESIAPWPAASAEGGSLGITIRVLSDNPVVSHASKISQAVRVVASEFHSISMNVDLRRIDAGGTGGSRPWPQRSESEIRESQGIVTLNTQVRPSRRETPGSERGVSIDGA
jgi:hypothetical protein